MAGASPRKPLRSLVSRIHRTETCGTRVSRTATDATRLSHAKARGARRAKPRSHASATCAMLGPATLRLTASRSAATQVPYPHGSVSSVARCAAGALSPCAKHRAKRSAPSVVRSARRLSTRRRAALGRPPASRQVGRPSSGRRHCGDKRRKCAWVGAERPGAGRPRPRGRGACGAEAGHSRGAAERCEPRGGSAPPRTSAAACWRARAGRRAPSPRSPRRSRPDRGPRPPRPTRTRGRRTCMNGASA